MFWRFGFHNPSAIDTLLDRDDISLEDILEEEDLLQEAKAHNQKLVEFLCHRDHLEKLLGYITASASELEESRRYRYPFLSCEIIACEIPQIIDAIVLDHKELLETFWKYLDQPAPPRRRVTDSALPKTTQNDDEVAQDVVGLDSIQASYFCRTINIFLTKRTQEVLQFIKSKPEILTKILSHLQTSSIMDLLLSLVRVEELQGGKGTVQWLSDQGLLDDLIDRLDPYLDSEEHSIAQQCISEIIRLSQTSLVESPSIGLNDLITNLKSERVIQKLVSFMLDSSAPNATSTLINGVTIIIDLIRHNNSDMENDPMLNSAYGYNANMVARQTSVSLADMLKVLADHVGDFNDLLIHPRSIDGPIKTTLGEILPLGFERLKICELFAELLHCSNMSNLNLSPNEEDAPAEYGTDELHPYGVETENRIAQEKQSQSDQDDEILEEKKPNADSGSAQDEEASGSGAPKTDSPDTAQPTVHTDDQMPAEKSASETALKDQGVDKVESVEQPQHRTQEVQPDPKADISVGDYLKTQFVEHRVMPTCIDLFFAFPWNNFLHYVVYDMLHQIFNGRMDKGYNRYLAISVFRDGKLTEKMVEAQKANDAACEKPKGMRLGYMGHLTFIADEVIKLFEGYPETIVAVIKDDIDLESWNNYCNTELRETKERDHLPLGGSRPNDGMEGGGTDEEEYGEQMVEESAYERSRHYSQDDEEEDESDPWATNNRDYRRGYMQGTGFGIGDDNEHFADTVDATQDELDDEEHSSDNDEESNGQPLELTREIASFPQTTLLQRTKSHVRENESDEDDEDLLEENDPFGDNDPFAPKRGHGKAGPISLDVDDQDDDPFAPKRDQGKSGLITLGVGDQEDDPFAPKKGQGASETPATGADDEDDDPFGDLQSSESAFDQGWEPKVTSQFEQLHISSNTEGQQDDPFAPRRGQGNPETPAMDMNDQDDDLFGDLQGGESAFDQGWETPLASQLKPSPIASGAERQQEYESKTSKPTPSQEKSGSNSDLNVSNNSIPEDHVLTVKTKEHEELTKENLLEEERQGQI